jgi:hypothetical protein
VGCCGKNVKRKARDGAESPPRPADYFIGPAEACALCAEKHLSTAYALACEVGYAVPNRQRIIGELTAATLHLWAEHRELAEKVRALRHIIQQRREAEAGWLVLIAEIDGLVSQSEELKA